MHPGAALQRGPPKLFLNAPPPKIVSPNFVCVQNSTNTSPPPPAHICWHIFFCYFPSIDPPPHAAPTTRPPRKVGHFFLMLPKICFRHFSTFFGGTFLTTFFCDQFPLTFPPPQKNIIFAPPNPPSKFFLYPPQKRFPP